MTTGLEEVLEYHERTKHGFQHFARGPGFLDWATQPDPFRRYPGAAVMPLTRVPPAGGPELYQALSGTLRPRVVDAVSISQLLYDSLAVSAWKRAGASTWALRVNPSSGNLHPTEGYLLSGPIPGLLGQPSICHYAPREHALEIRASMDEATWRRLLWNLPGQTLLLGLSSIHWREAWKYGERAYRYCQHDVGHAIATISIAAAALGWDTRMLDDASADELADLLGLSAQEGPEAEHPDCLIAVYPAGKPGSSLMLSESSRKDLGGLHWQGSRNRLSPGHVAWPAIDAVAHAAVKPKTPAPRRAPAEAGKLPGRGHSTPLRPVIHRRRSAVAMDGRTHIDAETFFRILGDTLPSQLRFPFATLPWDPQVHLALFVHRVEGIAPGIYLLARNPSHLSRLRRETDPGFDWETPGGCPEWLPLFRLQEGDARELAMQLSCRQRIAGDGCFSLAMLAHFEPPLAQRGAWFYPRLFWECGLIGQVLYLEAVANGIAGTGIGCFFDDPVHEVLGLRSRNFQSLYHFTLGGAVEDARLSSLPPYPGPEEP